MCTADGYIYVLLLCVLQSVLKAEFPRGVDVVYESVGGDMFDTAVGALAKRGRLLVIGMMSQ